MKTKLIIIGLAALLAAGCQHPVASKKFNQVHLGMTETEVVKVLGDPVSSAESKDGSRTLYYSVCESRIADQYASYSVKLVNGKVDSYGRDSSATSPQTVPIITPMPVVR